MEDQGGFAAIGLPAALAVIMVGIGLTLTKQGFKESLNSRGIVIAGMIGQLVLVPIIAIALSAILGLAPVFAIGLMLLAATPGGVTTNLFTHLGKGNVPLSIVLTVLASIAMLVTMPLWVWATGQILGHGDDVGLITVPPGPVLGLLIGVVGIPVIIGMTIRARKPDLAKRLEKIVSIVGVVTIVVMFLFLVIDLRDQIGDILRQTGPSVVIFTGLIMLAGWGIAKVMRRPVEDRVALAMEFGLRNSTMSLVIALTVIGDTEVAAPAALFSVVMYVYGGALVFARHRALKRATASVAASPAESSDRAEKQAVETP